MTLSTLIRQACAIAALALLNVHSLPASASGSYSVGGAQTNQLYNLGKSAFYRKLACSSCPLADQDIDEAKATEIVSDLTENTALAETLTETERTAVVEYLLRRYKLN